MVLIALRIDTAFEEVIALAKTQEWVGFAVRETNPDDGVGEHMHWYIQCSYKNAQTFRVTLKRQVTSLVGNKLYSAKEIPPDDENTVRYHRYMCKGKDKDTLPEVQWRYGLIYTDLWIAERHREYWQANDKLKKERKVDCFENVIQRCKDRAIRWHDRKAIAEQYFREMKGRRKPVNLFAAKAVINGIQLQLCDTNECIELFCCDI